MSICASSTDQTPALATLPTLPSLPSPFLLALSDHLKSSAQLSSLGTLNRTCKHLHEHTLASLWRTCYFGDSYDLTSLNSSKVGPLIREIRLSRPKPPAHTPSTTISLHSHLHSHSLPFLSAAHYPNLHTLILSTPLTVPTASNPASRVILRIPRFSPHSTIAPFQGLENCLYVDLAISSAAIPAILAGVQDGRWGGLGGVKSLHIEVPVGGLKGQLELVKEVCGEVEFLTVHPSGRGVRDWYDEKELSECIPLLQQLPNLTSFAYQALQHPLHLVLPPGGHHFDRRSSSFPSYPFLTHLAREVKTKCTRLGDVLVVLDLEGEYRSWGVSKGEWEGWRAR